MKVVMHELPPTDQGKYEEGREVMEVGIAFAKYIGKLLGLGGRSQVRCWSRLPALR